MAKVAKVANGILGNTETKIPRKPIDIRGKKWVFTLNNYEEAEVAKLADSFKILGEYIMGREVGESGTPHIQGYVELKNSIRLSGLKKINPRAHWEKARGNRAQNIEYCSKENKIMSTFPIPRATRLLSKYDDVKWKDWQQRVIDIIDAKICPRTIHWLYDKKGNVGKSFLCKYLYLKYDAIIGGGKSNDIFNQVNGWIEKHPDKDPTLVILDIPRTSMDYVNYGCIEKLKDGLFYSGKYEGGVCCFDIPHVIIFSNEEPNYDAVSKDRWNVINISDT